MQLRPYQNNLKLDVYAHWQAGARNVLAVAPTGSGKTVIFSSILAEYNAASCAIAHRQELVGQISLALARCGVRHGILAPPSVVRNIVSIQMSELGYSCYTPQAQCRVAGVDTLVRHDPSDPWLRQVGLWIQDEAHHMLAANKWGRAAALFPNARGLGVTATPMRADGKGLGRHADGLMDAMVVGPTMRDLIEQSYLTRYRIYAPPSDLNLNDVPIAAGGDYSPEPLREAVHKSRIVGDVVEHYLRLTPGKLGVTFAVDIESATQIAQAYNANGVRAEVVSSKTPDVLRAAILRRFAARDLLELVNVDIFGEGFDLPAIEVVSFARPTLSFPLYVQQFGRALRPLQGKDRAIIIDHVSNVRRHRLPDAPREWTLDRRDRASRGAAAADAIPIKVCAECESAYERTEASCPFCGHITLPSGRAAPAQVDGDLIELTPEALAALGAEIGRVDAAPRIPRDVDPIVARAIHNRHLERQQAQQQLRHAIALWGGVGQRPADVRRAQVAFFQRFGVDVMTAQALGVREAGELQARIERDLGL